MNRIFSFNGEIFHASQKKFDETILMVPFYGGSKRDLKKHIDWVNEIGYDVVIFDLKKSPFHFTEEIVSARGEMGLKHIWADQIEKVLNEIIGSKIIYSFSNPTSSSIEAIVRRRGIDIKALVCDSGPSGEMLSSIYNYFSEIEPVPWFPLRWMVSAGVTFLWSPDFTKSLNEDLKKFPSELPVLSIRGWQDTIITAQQIDKALDPHPHLNVKKLNLYQAQHLKGFKDYPDEYKQTVLHFLQGVSTCKTI